MWLASASWRNGRGIVATADWDDEQRRRAEQALNNTLAGVGNPSRQRLFRMNITMCLHRACSLAEQEMLPASFYDGEGGLAGGPVEILRVTGLSPRAAALPCEKPGHELIDSSRPDLWLPRACGRCGPCQARQKIERSKARPVGLQQATLPLEGDQAMATPRAFR